MTEIRNDNYGHDSIVVINYTSIPPAAALSEGPVGHKQRRPVQALQLHRVRAGRVRDLPQGVWTKHSERPSDAGPPTSISRGFH